LLNLTKRDISGKYKRTALGQLWSLINPVSQMVIFSLVFSFVMRARPPVGSPSGLDVFALWLSAALLPWIFFTNVLTGGMGAVLGNSNLVMKVWFPRYTLVASAALSALFTFSIEMTVLLVVVTLFGGVPWLYVPGIALTMVLLGALGLGLGFMLAIANVYFRDTSHFVAILLQMWFYATPIVYPIGLIQTSAEAHPSWHVMTIYRLNPVERFAEVFRAFVYDNRMPPLGASIFCVVVPLAVLALGWWVFNRHQGRMAEEL
jgi:ABC-2 type transport system permease protein